MSSLRVSSGRKDAPGSDVPSSDVPFAEATRGGEWLTYRYRLGGEGTPEATGTMKAPSFLSAARRILARITARGLGGTTGPAGPAPAYLRLRAAGEQEVLLRLTRTGGSPDAGAGGGFQLDVVPGDTYQFVPPPETPGPEGGEPTPT